MSNVYPAALEQRCWNHKVLNVLDKLPKKVHLKAKKQLRDIVYSESQHEAEEKRDLFVRWCQKEGYYQASEALTRDWERMVTFYRSTKEHWRHLWTTNVVESPFAALRIRTDAAKRCKKVDNATAVIWKMLMLAEQRFHRLDAPEKMKLVYLDFSFEEGLEAKQEKVLAVA